MKNWCKNVRFTDVIMFFVYVEIAHKLWSSFIINFDSSKYVRIKLFIQMNKNSCWLNYSLKLNKWF